MYMLIIQYCYTGGSIKHETNGTLQYKPIVFSDCIINSATGALVQLFSCTVYNYGTNKYDSTFTYLVVLPDR